VWVGRTLTGACVAWCRFALPSQPGHSKATRHVDGRLPTRLRSGRTTRLAAAAPPGRPSASTAVSFAFGVFHAAGPDRAGGWAQSVRVCERRPD
jgi:hypothetical protein